MSHACTKWGFFSGQEKIEFMYVWQVIFLFTAKNFFKFCSSFFFLFFHDNDKFVENIEFSSICAECIISSLRPDNLKMGYFSHVLSVDN